jgi:phosphate transport system permease protein
MTTPSEPVETPVRRGRSVASLATERGVEFLIRACGFSAIFFVFAIFLFVVGSGAEFIVHRLDFREFLFSTEWVPTSRGDKRYGTLALTVGTVSVTALAMAIAVPFGLGAAIFVSEFTTGRRKEVLKVVIELLAAIPSVVWGFIGLVMINPLIIDIFDAPIGLNVLNGGIILGLMSVPIIVSIGEDALKAVPDSYREASLAMGASRWQTITKVLLPAARNGLLAAVLLGIARAIGETIAVLMATGHAVQIPHSPLDSVRTLTATIASELGEAAQGSDHYQALFAIGVLLFTLTFAVNLTADLMVRGRKASR